MDHASGFRRPNVIEREVHLGLIKPRALVDEAGMVVTGIAQAGEIICRRQNDSDLAKQPVGDLLLNFVAEDGGPLIWPRITESAQNAFDATCRKLHRFLYQQKKRS